MSKIECNLCLHIFISSGFICYISYEYIIKLIYSYCYPSSNISLPTVSVSSEFSRCLPLTSNIFLVMKMKTAARWKMTMDER